MPDTKEADGSSKEREVIIKGMTPMTPLSGGGYAPIREPARADFQKWARLDSWHIAEGVMLILGFEPFDVNAHSWPKGAAGFDDIYRTAVRSINAGTLAATPRHFVRPHHFLGWAHERGYRVPRKLEELVNRFHPKDEGRPQGGADGPKWPWGSHDTELLRHLATAADRFWKNYDRDPTTAPTNQEVIGWLVEHGVAQRTAEVMATILRADGLPTGPRK